MPSSRRRISLNQLSTLNTYSNTKLNKTKITAYERVSCEVINIYVLFHMKVHWHFKVVIKW
jgi:hypothetical protein